MCYKSLLKVVCRYLKVIVFSGGFHSLFFLTPVWMAWFRETAALRNRRSRFRGPVVNRLISALSRMPLPVPNISSSNIRPQNLVKTLTILKTLWEKVSYYRELHPKQNILVNFFQFSERI